MKVTVESCLAKVDNRFKLVLMAAKRAKDLDRGARPAVAREDDKSTIVAMREISEEAISLDSLENITRSNIVNRNNEMQVDEEEEFFDTEANDDDNDDDIDDDENAMEDDEIDESLEDEMEESSEDATSESSDDMTEDALYEEDSEEDNK